MARKYFEATGNHCSEDRMLRYDRPALNFNEALPIGNGRSGAMVHGNAGPEILPINDDRFWAGRAPPAPSPSGPVDLAAVREKLFAGDYVAAEEIAEQCLLTGYNQPYLPAADIELRWPAGANNYLRSLDLATAIAEVTYDGTDGENVSRQYFASAVDHVIVVRAEMSDRALVAFTLDLTSKLRCTGGRDGDDTFVMADAPVDVVWPGVDDRIVVGQGIAYEDTPPRACCTMARTLRETGDRGRSILTVLIATATGDTASDLRQACRSTLDAAAAFGYPALRQRHIEAHAALFDRVELRLGPPLQSGSDMMTDERIGRHAQGCPDAGLEALLFDYGRYLMISSSRPGTQAINLQGIWNDLVQPPWWSNYTLNINLEMNYWPAEVCNLSECHEPLFDFIEELSRTGTQAARVHYGMRGWVAHHQTDHLRQATPVGRINGHRAHQPVRYALWPMAGGWLCRHLWEHYLYTGDLTLLRERHWPLMCGAAAFFLDWLVETPDGLLTTAPSTSPENTYLIEGRRNAVCIGSAMDLSIIRHHFEACLSAARDLAVIDDSLVQEIEAALPRLAGLSIGSMGQIMEWNEDWPEGEHPHRHVSQLFGLFPGTEISPRETPDLAAAARRTLELRGEPGTGWSFAWKAALWARLGNGSEAYGRIRRLLNPVPSQIFETGDEGGGIYRNLLMACPPFQIDANFGYTAAIAEMLVQSHEGDIVLLPALPLEWSEGAFRGLRCRGGVEIAMRWENGAPQSVTLLSEKAQQRHLRFGETRILVDLPAGIELEVTLAVTEAKCAVGE